MRRREFVGLIGGAVAAWPFAANAQQTRMRRIGILMSAPEDDPEFQGYVTTFREQLKKFGWTEGDNILFDYRWAALNDATQARYAKELVGFQPDLILAQGTPTTKSLIAETRTLPVIFAIAVDPVGSGFVASLPKPGGNVTGFTGMEATMGVKWLELLKEVSPQVTRAAFLFNPTVSTFSNYYLTPFKAAAPSFGVLPIPAPVRTLTELETVVAEQSREPNGGLIVMPDGFLHVYRAELVSLADRYRLPAVYAFRFFTEIGGLIAYGNDQADNYRRSAIYADKILKGEKPGELPVQAPERFELTINLKTARSLGLDLSPALIDRADKVFE